MKRLTDPADVPIFLRKHASVLFEMPAGEQFIGARDTVLNSAFHQIADWIEQHDRAQPIKAKRRNRPQPMKRRSGTR
jgi:hypothetical protein